MLRHLVLAATLLSLSGCASKVGSKSLGDVRFSYNEALAASSEEQMLLNLVRMRYLHSVQFLELGSVVTQYSVTTNAGVNGGANIVGQSTFTPPASFGGQVGVEVSERPTVTYTPLQGEAFVRRLATPVRPEAMMLLVESGWSWDLLLGCCIVEMGGIHSPTIASKQEEGNDYRRLAKLLTALQQRREITVHFEPAADGGLPDPYLVLEPELSPEAEEVLGLLGLHPLARRFLVSSMYDDGGANAVIMRGRSLLSAMFYLSQGVEAPTDDGVARDLGVAVPIAQPYLRVQTADRRPKEAYVAVPYRDRWYYIADTDRSSKHVFVLISFLFNLMASPGGQAPLLTVPTG